jgi:hypothetical protein
MFCRSLFVLFLLAIVLSALLRFTDSDYPFGIFKLFLYLIHERLVVIIRKSIALSPRPRLNLLKKVLQINCNTKPIHKLAENLTSFYTN